MILEENGRFWWHEEPVPEGHYAPENSVTGTIKIDDEGRTTVDLHGALTVTKRKVEILGANRIEENVAIQGRLTGTGRHVLLLGLNQTAMKFASYGMYEGYRAEFCLVGTAMVPATMQEVAIDRIAVELTGYEEWLHLESIAYARDETEFTATYKKPDDIDYPLDDGALMIKHELYAPFGTHRLQKFDAREVVSCICQLKPAAPLKVALQRYQLIQDILILLTNASRALDLPTVGLSGVEGEYTFYFQRHKSADKGPGRFEAWIDFPSLRADFGAVFAQWKAKRELFGPAFYLYLGTRRGQPQYIENRYLNLIVGLEAFHRQKFPEHATSKALAAKVERILADVQRTRDRKWLGIRLRTAAEPSLEERLWELFRTVPFAPDKDALNGFAKDCARLRNDISHFGGWRKHGDYNDFMAEVHARSEVASGFYQALILQEIGLNGAQLEWWFRQSPKAWPLKHYMQRFGLWKEPPPASL